MRTTSTFGLFGEENFGKGKKSLTSELKIDNLEKFAKTSLAAEVILEEVEVGLKKASREIPLSGNK